VTVTETAFTALGYAIRNGELRTVRDILEGDEFNHQLLKSADYAGNTVLRMSNPCCLPPPRVQGMRE
jgi:lysophospholipase